MSLTLDERAREASDALHAAVELRRVADPASRTRAPVRVLVTTALLVIVIAVAAVFALRAAAPRSSGLTNQPPSGGYQATAIIIALGGSIQPARYSQIRADARLLRIGAVPERAATALHLSKSPAELVAQLQIVVDAKVGVIRVTTRQSSGRRAERLVDTFGQEFVRHFQQIQNEDYAARLARMTQNEKQLRDELAAAKQQQETHAGQDPKGEVLGLTNALKEIDHGLNEVRKEGPFAAQYRLVEGDQAVHVASGARTSRRALEIGLLVLVVLALGAALGFGLGRRRATPRT